jgi:hypothetical protein
VITTRGVSQRRGIDRLMVESVDEEGREKEREKGKEREEERGKQRKGE